MRCGHDPRTVGWHWPLHRLLAYVHAELRRQGLRTYRPSAWQPILTDERPAVSIDDPWAGID